MKTLDEQKRRPVTPGAPRPVERKCFMCGTWGPSQDKEPPFRCNACLAAVAMNEADGEL